MSAPKAAIWRSLSPLAVLAAAVGQRLTEIPGARAHHSGRSDAPGHGCHRLRAASFEAPDRVERLDLQRHRAAEHVTERRARQRRRVEEHRIDRVDGTADLIELKPNAIEATHANAACHAPGSRMQSPQPGGSLAALKANR